VTDGKTPFLGKEGGVVCFWAMSVILTGKILQELVLNESLNLKKSERGNQKNII